MGFRFRKSFKLFSGVRLNLSKTGVGASVGFPGFRLTKRADGKIQRTASIPGTGISYVTTHTPGAKTRRKSRALKQPQTNMSQIDPVSQVAARDEEQFEDGQRPAIEVGQLASGVTFMDNTDDRVLPSDVKPGTMFGISGGGMFLDLDALYVRAIKSLILVPVSIGLSLWAYQSGIRTEFSQSVQAWIFAFPAMVCALDSYVHSWVLHRCTDTRASGPKVLSAVALALVPLLFLVSAT
ncbi:MAG: DUF4236 domain-containing protein [Actinobacteria bacterium]|uniref:Unannotated protein n=1 Tax=freshwater metagenome TaxID=449393 RepID=A0A6J5ZRV8_9ZZZZ|nr:DUF4236 domain-containing protein [Actinomycetota bacterium]